MKKIKIVWGLALAIVVSAGLWACSNDEPAPDKPDTEVSEVVAALSDDYWVVTDTKIVAPDGQEYSNWSDSNLDIGDGILPMLGVRLGATELRLYTYMIAKFCYADLPIVNIEGKVLFVDTRYSSYDAIKLESIEAQRVIVSYWHDMLYYSVNTAQDEPRGIAKGAYMKSTLRKAIPEEIEKMKNAIYVRDAYH